MYFISVEFSSFKVTQTILSLLREQGMYTCNILVVEQLWTEREDNPKLPRDGQLGHAQPGAQQSLSGI
jgi:hypothetical protein